MDESADDVQLASQNCINFNGLGNPFSQGRRVIVQQRRLRPPRRNSLDVYNREYRKRRE
jgi:hypothetical protein